MKPFHFTGIHHAAFATADMDKTVEFWRDLLGFRLAITFDSSSGKQYAFALPMGMLIYFFEWPDISPPPPKRHGMPVKGPFHFDHIALGLASKGELFRLQDQLVECDFPVSDVVDHGYLNSIYTFDPNGIPLEFNWLSIPLDFEQHPVLADKNPSKTISQSTSPVPGRWPESEKDDLDRTILEGEDSCIFKG